MTHRMLISTDKVVKNIFEISENFKVVPRPIFRADSKSVLHFVIRLILAQQIKKQHANYTFENIQVPKPLKMKFSGAYTVLVRQVGYLHHGLTLINLSAPLRTSPHL